ncbi:MAG: PEP-CTERM sorting domain-containing protein [Myxococcota bacterium]
MTQRTFRAALVFLVLLAGPAAASSIGKSSPHSAPKPAPTLQQILDGLVVSGPAIDANASQNIELWQNTSSPLTARVAANFTGKEKVSFGIYDPDQATKPAYLLRDALRDVATVTFSDDDTIVIRSGLQKKASGFDGPFGFVLKDTPAKHQNPAFIFTQADLNGGVRVKVFQGNDSTMLKLPGQRPGLFLDSQFLIAFETGSTDKGFNDYVVLVSGIVPGVPEPATLGLIAISLAVLVGRRGRSA